MTDLADGTDEDEFPGADFPDVETVYEGLGLTLAYDFNPVVLSLGVVSEHDWTDRRDERVQGQDRLPHKDGDDPTPTPRTMTHTYIPKDGEDADLEAKVSYAHEYVGRDRA